MSSMPPTAAFAVAEPDPDATLLAGLRAGNERAFLAIVEGYGPAMLRLARLYAPNQAVAEEVVQEAWIGVLQGLERFEGRSSLKTWCCRIVINIAKTRGERESRQIPFSAYADPEADGGDAAVEPDRFLSPDHQWAGHWVSYPQRWDEIPETRALSSEIGSLIREALETLPPSQREVITLRDVDGWASEEVCNVLGISATNQRVLLHRARSRVRRALDEYLVGDVSEKLTSAAPKVDS